jgi:tetratricopeptide (TPR) repeat protein
MRTARFVHLICCIVLIVLDAPAAPQRTRRPSPGVTLPPGLADILQPESVRSILFIYSGRDLSKARATELEANLQKTPDKIDDRLILIGYYSWKGQTASDSLRLRTHVLWIVENHPEHASTTEQSLRDLPGDPEGNARILALWNQHLESRGDDLRVLKNAERFFFGMDPAEAERIVYRLAEKEPNNREWPDELSKLYRMFGIPGYPADDPGATAMEAYRRVLELTKNSEARKALAGDMAQSAFRVGNFSGAMRLAQLDLRNSDPSFVQRANTLLGRVAVRSDDLVSAGRYLLDSARVETPRYGFTFAPPMVLAKELLERGERDVVVQYLESCLAIWPHGEKTLQIWIDDVKADRMPNFGTSAF